jgi:hypothetical protein
MKNSIEKPWPKLEISLQAAAIKQRAIHPNLVFSICNHPNEAFLVKAH